MIVCDPAQFLNTLDEETYSGIQDRFGSIERFLSPGDSFKFTCDRSGKCCRDRYDKPILLSPYDVYRLRNDLNISSRQFADRFGQRILGADSQLPILLLDFQQTSKNHNKCPFLMSYGCKVYEDRPLVCRLYPVGRMIDTDMSSYFFLTKTPDYCRVGSGREYTIEQWLEQAEVEPYFKWNDRFNSLYMEINYKKYHALNMAYKATLGTILYDFDSVERTLPRNVLENLKTSEKDSQLDMSYRLAKQYVERFLK